MKMFTRNGLGLITILMLVGLGACSHKAPLTTPSDPLFRRLTAEQTNISFENTLTEGPNTNVLLYEYFYNGGL